MLKGQITSAQKVSIYGQKQNKEKKGKKDENHITGQLPASLQF